MTSALTVLHVDMDAFYASVEVRDNPSLSGLPVCVGGPASSRGVISAASYEAREFGVHSAMPTAQARRLCPQLVLLPPDFDRYTAVSRQVMGIFQRYTPLVEPLSLDEAFLDVSGTERLFGDAVEVGKAVKADILRETGLVASIGIAPSKFVAKLASDLDKPDGFCVVQPEEVRPLLDPLPVSKLFGVGERSSKRLSALGITTIGQLARRSRDEVVREFGATGAWIHDLAHGRDGRRVNPHRREKSHGMERTFPEDISHRDELRRRLCEYCEEVAFVLRERGLRGRTVTVKARYWNFRTVTRSKTLDHPTNLGPRLFAAARELFDRVPGGPLRLLGVSLSSLEDVRTPQQGELFGAPEEDDRLRRTAEGLDRLREKYGKRLVQPGSSLRDKSGPGGGSEPLPPGRSD